MPFSQLKDNIIDFLIAKVAYVVSFSGYLFSIKLNLIQMNGVGNLLIEGFIHLLFGVALFITTLIIKHIYDIKYKNNKK